MPKPESMPERKWLLVVSPTTGTIVGKNSEGEVVWSRTKQGILKKEALAFGDLSCVFRFYLTLTADEMEKIHNDEGISYLEITGDLPTGNASRRMCSQLGVW